MKLRNKILIFLADLYRVWRRELRLVFRDEGVVIFFFVLCAIYPVLYALIYNPETAHDIAVVIVDDDRSQMSREFVRKLDATPEVCVVQYAANMTDAQRMMHEKDCYGIVYFPRGFERDIFTDGIQGHVSLYCDMSVLMRYKQMLMGVTMVQQGICNEMMAEKIAVVTNTEGSVIESKQVPLANTAMGLASAVLPCILVLVLQQSMLLGIGMLHGGSRERRLNNRGYDPMDMGASVPATILGRTLCHWMLYMVPTIYVLYFVPVFFDFPQNGHIIDIALMTIPFLIASSMMGQTISVFVNDRESVFITLVFTSVIFVFLTGVSWPRYSMGPLWIIVGNAIPTTWACNSYMLMQSGGASLEQLKEYHFMLWALAGVYFVFACVVEKYILRPRYRRMKEYAKDDPDALMREERRRNAVDC
ncbi:MAG: ABC transporter permease [Muribaculaceae bacterium]|nr:ABC transporter permease [Muribaculaceae bacterium]